MADPVSYGIHERDIEQAFLALKKGSQLVKYSRKGKPKFCPFRLSSDETALIWISHGREKSLKLSSVSHIIPGQRTAVFRRYLRPEKDYLSFSLIYKKGDRSLDLICKDTAEVEVWFEGLKALISTGQHYRRARSELKNDNVESIHKDRPFGAAVEFTSSVARRRLSVDSISHEYPLDSVSSNVGSEHANMPVRTSVGDGSRFSVSSTTYASSVASGPDDIESIGEVFIWGEVRADGVLPDGMGNTQVLSKADVLIPKPLEHDIVLDVQQIGCGVHHIALVTRQGEVFTWGENTDGRLGHGSDKDCSTPHLVESLAVTNVSFVACGEYHTCAMTTSGDLFTWGDETHNAGLLGHGTDVSYWIPKRVAGPLEGLQVVSVACGVWHSALATSNGKLFTFGDGKFGVLGHGDRESILYPKEVLLLNGLKAIKVACGVWHTAAIIEVMDQSSSNATSSRKLFTWGDGDQYRLGHANKDTYLRPTCVSALAEYNFHQIACGNTMTIALTSSGHVFTMGGTAYGQLGNPTSDGKVPILIRDKLLGEFVEEISCGSHHTAALTSRSELYTWGRGANGRLGHGDTDDKNSPTLVEAFKDRLVKYISCGSSFTCCICMHKWVSGADQSACSGCRQPFSFTRKRHNCYNCGLVFCHPCSSKKALRAALASTHSKPHRVCDACYAKLKGPENGSASTFSKDFTRPHSSIYGKERSDRGGVKHSRIFLSSITEPIKYLEMSTSKPGSTHDSSSMIRAAQVPTRSQLKDVGFPNSSNVMQNTSNTVTQPSQIPTPPAPTNSRPAPPHARRASPPHSTSPGFSRSLIDNLKRKNELLNQEVAKFKNQIRNLKQKSNIQDIKIQELQKNIEEATSLAREESSKHREVQEILKSMTDQLKEVTEKLPPDISDSENLRTMHTHAQDFLKEKIEFESCYFQSSFEFERQSAPFISSFDSDSSNLPEQRLEENVDAAEADPSINGENVLQESKGLSVFSAGVPLPNSEISSRFPSLEISSRSAKSYEPGRDREVTAVDQFERGVYVTVIVLPSGNKVFKRVRFSKRRFNEHQAEEWWNQNKDRVFRRYSSSSSTTKDAASGSSITLPHLEDSIEASSSS